MNNSYPVAERSSFELTVPYYDAQYSFRASPAAILRYVENAAAGHCADIGRDITKLLQEDSGWILTKGQLAMQRYPRYLEKIRIETWVSKRSRFQSSREYLIYGEGDELLGSSRGNWVFIDSREHKPKAIDESFVRGWPIDPRTAMEREMPKRLDGPPSFQQSLEAKALRHDIDSNLHVNNVRYLEWALEAVPQSWYAEHQLSYIEGSFKHEALLGDRVLIGCSQEGSSFRHAVIRKSDGLELAAAYSEWL